MKLLSLGLPTAKKVIVAVIGGTVLLFGVCLIFLPGPAFLVIPAGLAILATEFVWARRWLQKARAMAVKARNSLKRPSPATRQVVTSPSAPPSTKKNSLP